MFYVLLVNHEDRPLWEGRVNEYYDIMSLFHVRNDGSLVLLSSPPGDMQPIERWKMMITNMPGTPHAETIAAGRTA